MAGRFAHFAKTSEQLAQEALESDDGIWVTYYVGSPDTDQPPLKEWLEDNSPSKLRSEDGIGWICIARNDELSIAKRQERRPDVTGLEGDWRQLQDSNDHITSKDVLSLAKSRNVTVGKWMAFARTGPHIDHLWATIATAMAENRMDVAISAKVNPLSETSETGKHVVCVYNEDCTNEQQVYDLDHSLRANGVHTRMAYKPDAYTYLGIYRRNRWKIRPTLYSSDYNIPAGQLTRSTLHPWNRATHNVMFLIGFYSVAVRLGTVVMVFRFNHVGSGLQWQDFFCPTPSILAHDVR